MRCPVRRSEMKTTQTKDDNNGTITVTTAKLFDFSECYKEQCMAYNKSQCALVINMTMDEVEE
jgi:hypothetical protein